MSELLEEMGRFQSALTPLNLELRVTFPRTRTGPAVDLDIFCLCWCPNHKDVKKGDSSHILGISASYSDLKRCLISLKNQIEDFTDCAVDYP